MQVKSKYNKGIRYLLCVIDLSSIYTWDVPLKDKKGATITNAFQKASEFYNNSFKKWLKDNGIGMYSTYNEGIY